MESIDKSIKALSRAVMKKARADADQVLADAKAKADAVREQAQQQAEKERKEILERAQQEAERIRSQGIAGAQLKARTLKLEQREKLLDDVFGAVRQRLPTVQQWTDYDQVVLLLVREAVGRLKAKEGRICADERAREILSKGTLVDLSEELGVQLQLGEPLRQGVGVIAKTPDGHREYDNTLEARLNRWHDELRFSVYHLLMGESL
jgi:V/A-type H+-transporting ATPase subunit E